MATLPPVDMTGYVQLPLEAPATPGEIDDWLATSTASACSIDDPECEACQ